MGRDMPGGGYATSVLDEQMIDESLIIGFGEPSGLDERIPAVSVDFKDLAVLFGYYDVEIKNSIIKDKGEKYSISRKDMHENIRVYHMENNTMEDFEVGCSYDYEEKSYSPKTAVCEENYKYAHMWRASIIDDMLTGLRLDEFEDSALICNSLMNDVELTNQYCKEIVKYVNENYHFDEE